MTNNYFNPRLLLASGALLLASFAGNAKVAYPGIMAAQQPDGTTVNIRLEGDARCHRAYSSDGYLLTTDAQGFYVFADCGTDNLPVATTIRAINPESRTTEISAAISAISQEKVSDAFTRLAETATPFKSPRKGPGLFDDSYPVTGEQKGLVILVEFADNEFTSTDDPHDYFHRLLNEEGFDTNGGTGSARDFYVANSGGLFQPTFDVYGPVKLEHNIAYYGQNNTNGNDKRAWQMIVDACLLLDDEIDFSEYDRNGDGIIDNVYVYYAGYGEADGGSSDTIWPHSWNVTYGTAKKYYLDDMLLDRYACSNEIDGIYKRTDGLGTFVHEFSHVMGLPDLYCTTNATNPFTPGEWSIMDVGSYNNQSRTPPNYSAFERYALGWMDPEVLSEPGDYTLEPVHTSNHAFIVKTESENEYFLFENRQREGNDAYIPGHGMLVWHIDLDDNAWYYNAVNNDPNHQRVDIVEADNTRTARSRIGDTFPGNKKITKYTFLSKPAFVDWNNESPGLDITDIAESDEGIISFTASYYDSAVDMTFGDFKDSVVIDGKMVSSTAGIATAYDMTGREIAKIGNIPVELPSGFYILTTGSGSKKVVIK